MRVLSVLFATAFVFSVAVVQGDAAPQAPAAPKPAPAKPAAPRAAAAPAARNAPVGTLIQVMRGIMFPNSNRIFDVAVNTPKVEPGTAGTYTGWPGVENAAIAMAEAVSLITMPGRLCDNGKPVPVNRPDFQKFAAGLKAAAEKAYKAAQTKNVDSVNMAADDLSVACENCHLVYRDKPPGQDRCIP